MIECKKIEYDNYRRMKYHPDYHPNQDKPYTVSDLVYICQNYESKSKEEISLAVGRTPGAIMRMVYKLRKDGMFEEYKNMDL